MKKFIILLLIGASLTTFAQKQIDGAMGIKFGASPDSVYNVLKERGGKIDRTNPNSFIVNDLTFGGMPTTVMNFEFVDKKLFQILVSLKAEKDPLTIDMYNEILGNLTKIYGTSTSTRKFNEPYSETKYADMAIRRGEGKMSDVWIMGNNAISLIITTRLEIGLVYMDRKLQDIQNKGRKPMDDY